MMTCSEPSEETTRTTRRDPYRNRASPHLDICPLIKAVELVQQLEHRALDFLLAAGVGVVSLCADGVDLRRGKRREQ